MSPVDPQSWWSTELRFRETTLQIRRHCDSATITVGETGTFVIPGVGGHHVLADGHSIRHVPGLRRIPDTKPNQYRFYVAAHPHVQLWIERQTGSKPAYDSNFRLVPWRELLTILAIGAVVVALAIGYIRSLMAVADGGMFGMDKEAKRVLFGVRTEAPAPISNIGLRPPTGAGAQDDATAPVPQAPPRQPAASAVASRPGDGGRQSHSAAGGNGTPGGTNGPISSLQCTDSNRAPKQNLDVVFVLDVSTTMGFIVGRLADQVQALDQTIRKSGITPRYGLVLFVDDVIVAQQGSAFSSLDALERELDRWSRFAATNRQLTIDAPNLDWPENGLDALFHAATQFHWRQLQDTGRLIVFASDDTFGVPGDSLSSVVRVEHGYAEVMDTLVANDIHVASFTSKIGGRCECLDVTPGWLTPYRNMQSIPLGSGGAAFDIDDVAGEFLSFGQALGPLIEGTACDDRPAEAPSRHDGPA